MYERQFFMQQNTNLGKANLSRGKRERNQVSLLSLEAKRQEAKNEWLFLMILRNVRPNSVVLEMHQIRFGYNIWRF